MTFRKQVSGVNRQGGFVASSSSSDDAPLTPLWQPGRGIPMKWKTPDFFALRYHASALTITHDENHGSMLRTSISLTDPGVIARFENIQPHTPMVGTHLRVFYEGKNYSLYTPIFLRLKDPDHTHDSAGTVQVGDGRCRPVNALFSCSHWGED